MNDLINKFSVFLFLIGSLIQSQGQDQYMTASGQMSLFIEEGDSLISKNIKNVTILLDYDHASLKIEFHPEDTLASRFPNHDMSFGEKITILQNFSLTKIETQSHPDWSFSSTGSLSVEGIQFDLSGYGQLVHYHGSSTISCRIDLQLEPVNSDILIEPFGKIIGIRLIQNVLNKAILDGQSTSDGH